MFQADINGHQIVIAAYEIIQPVERIYTGDFDLAHIERRFELFQTFRAVTDNQKAETGRRVLFGATSSVSGFF